MLLQNNDKDSRLNSKIGNNYFVGLGIILELTSVVKLAFTIKTL